jgi:chromosome partitioning protein
MLDNTMQAVAKAVVASTQKLPRPRSLDDLGDISDFARAMLENVRENMTAPHPRKVAPTYSLAQISALCQLDKSQASYIVANKADGLPTGSIVGGNRKREFTLAEAQLWVDKIAPFGKRPKGVRGKKICIGNFKGGVTKTTTALALAQGLSLRGRRVLMIDLDPQGSLTTLNGILADSEVEVGQTIMPLIYGEQDNLEYAVQETYWKGIDLIPSCGIVSGAEFYLPAMQAQDRSFEFWNVINTGIDTLLDKYDVIIFDTPPALSYLTINAFMASDAMIVPSPPNALDYASSVQFWSLFADFSSTFMKLVPTLKEKRYDFINVLLSKVENTRPATSIVRDWIKMTYKDMVLPVEISATSGVLSAAAQFGTVYDVSNYGGTNKIYLRTREEYDALAALIDGQLMALWNSEGAQLVK